MPRFTLTVAARLALAFALLVALLVASVGFGHHALSASNAAMRAIYEKRTVALKRLDVVRYLGARDRIILGDAAAHGDEALTRRRLAEFAKNRAIARAEWDAYLATSPANEESTLAKALEQHLRRYVDDGLRPLGQALAERRYDDARGLLDSRISPLSPPMQAKLDQLIDLQVRLASETDREASTSNDRALTILLAAGLLAVVAGALAGTSIARQLAGQLGAEPDRLAGVARRIATGDLSAAEAETSHGAGVMGSLEAMRTNLAAIVGRVREASESIATGSQQIATGNADLSQRTEEQASALEQTAATMDQLTVNVQNNAGNARQADRLAGDARDVAAQGGAVVARVVETMRAIDDSSRRVADIIGVIDGIAFQTNILALNAAVEAARAGEQGRGFAVVAAEVRSLAGRSAEAAKEIKTLISRSVAQVAEGSTLVDRAGRTMEDVVASIGRVSDVVAEISAASAEQSTGIAQIGQAVAQMDQATQQNAALVEESAAAAESLRQQSRQLVETVRAFRLVSAAPD